MNLKEMSEKELKKLVKEIKKELSSRLKVIKAAIEEAESEDLSERYEFNFYAERKNNYSTPKPYVARCDYDFEKIDFKRKFKRLDETKGSNIVVEGKFTAEELEILDIRDSESRSYNIVLDGKIQTLCYYNNTRAISLIKQYLKKDIELTTLLELCEVKEVEEGVIDELKD